jgi:hypothetical protein
MITIHDAEAMYELLYGILQRFELFLIYLENTLLIVRKSFSDFISFIYDQMSPKRSFSDLDCCVVLVRLQR